MLARAWRFKSSSGQERTAFCAFVPTMFTKVSIIRTVENWNRTLAICLAFGLIAAIGALDYVTGYQLSFFLLYLLPVSLLAWKGGRWIGLAGSAVSAAAWAAANISAGLVYSSPLILYWNGAVRLFTFAIITILISSLKELVAHFEAMSLIDPLTGAANSRAFLEQLKREARSCAPQPTTLHNFLHRLGQLQDHQRFFRPRHRRHRLAAVTSV